MRSLLPLLSIPLAIVAVTVHHQPSLVPSLPDPISLADPPRPTPAPPNSFTVPVSTDPNPSLQLSIPQSGAFFGFSIDLAVAGQLSTSSSSANAMR